MPSAEAALDVPSFWCVRHEAVLGEYQTGRWVVHRPALASPIDQIVVPLHERLHHELQHSSPWGLMTEMLAAIAKAQPTYREQFERLARFGRIASRTAHEIYATGHSVGTDARRLGWLAGNKAYQRFYDLAVQLAGGDLDGGRLRFDALVRCAMAPTDLAQLLESGLDTLRIRDLDIVDMRPDARLVRILGSRSAIEAPGDPDGRTVPELESYHDAVTEQVRAAGIPVLDAHGIRAAFGAIIASVATLDAGLHSRLEVDSVREPVADDLETGQREQIVLRASPLPLQVGAGGSEAERAFVNVDPEIGPFVLLTWVKSTILRQQFEVSEDVAPDTNFVVAITAPVGSDGAYTAVNGLVEDGAHGPDVFASHLGEVRTLTLTTAATLLDAPGTATSAHVPVLYALVDTPVLEHLEHTLGAPARVEWDSFDLRSGNDELSITVFSVDALPGIRWLHLGTIAGRSYLHGWLSHQTASTVRRSQESFYESQEEIRALARAVTHTWHRLSMLQSET